MNSETILNYLEMVANNNLLVNLSMHITALIALTVIVIVFKQNLRRQIFHAAISILFLSVTINAFVFGNPFHGVTFGILTITAIVQLFTCKRNIQISNNKWNVVIALVFIFMGLWYPEFVKKNVLILLMVSPVGVVPCPTLITTIGLMTLITPSISKIQYAITLIMGIVYGIIGIFVFKVYLDVTLLLLVLYSMYNYLYQIKRHTNICI